MSTEIWRGLRCDPITIGMRVPSGAYTILDVKVPSYAIVTPTASIGFFATTTQFFHPTGGPATAKPHLGSQCLSHPGPEKLEGSVPMSIRLAFVFVFHFIGFTMY